ncbi:ubiquitin domain-containing protein DSK2b-like isoform X2 [Impatiens glandulifera]|uniref:ubiquitin domain-containing protein DSK2b-like isoform X2 n=1 Tax=Impatiens glandulifera TaxID=253017 RepID=UPI001FB1999A|nr:ubiquitin domain-containing protein DSK2b-like isoform X2 [Impatiens glandulifera]
MGVEGTSVSDGTDSKGTGAGVSVNVRCSNGSKFSVQANLDSDVRSFKSVLALNCDIPADQQRLIYKGRILKDDETLESYGLEAEHTVHLVRGFAQSSSPNTVAAANTGIPSSTPNTRQGGPEESGAFGGLGSEASLFPGLDLNGIGGGTGGLFGAGLPDFENMQRQFTQNPNIMRDIMNMPVVQNLMNNPDIIQNLIMNNPQMREVIDRNPELAHVLNDPATLRQTMEAARNPELLREMMRNTDRAMNNIESSPEGFNMLRRMYENVQEPFLNATTMAGDTGNDNPFASLLGTPGGGQGHVRDQATNPTSAGHENAASAPVPNADPLPNPWASGAAGGAQANSTARSNTGGYTRQPSVAGLSGLDGLPLDQMFGSTNDASSLSQFMQNPAVSELMQSLLSNPQYMNQMLGMNPQLRNVVDSNTQLREMMQNPDFIRQLTSPEMTQQLLNFQQTLPLLGARPTTGDASQTGGGAGLDTLMNMFSGLGIGGMNNTPNRPNVAPEELYATQLSQLQEMGFFDVQENLRALIATSGNVHAAVERLLGNMGQ